MRIRHIVSFGAGVNSGAMLTLLRLKKVPIDEVIFSDVGDEEDRTYNWIEKEAKPYFKKERIKFTIVQSKLGRKSDYMIKKRILPCVTRRDCTDKWKIRPIIDYVKENYQDDLVFMYIGYDADEPIRAYKTYNHKDGRSYRRLPYIPIYPLVQYGITREKCKKYVQALELRIPIKSRCIDCPNRQEKGFYDLWKNEPHNFDRAMLVEESNKRFKNRHRDKMPFTLLANNSKTLRKLKSKFESQTRLLQFLPIPHLMLEYKPHKPKVEGSPCLEETSEGRTSIPPTNELAGILEVIL